MTTSISYVTQKSRPVWVSLALLLSMALSTGLSSCQNKVIDPNEVTTYSGPIVSAKNVETRYSDSAILRVVLKTPLQYEFNSGDREFPEGLHLDFYDEKGVFTSTMDSKYGRYDRLNDIYVGIGEVVIVNVLEQKKMETEELKWNRATKQIYTDKFVRITTPTELLTGMGLEAKQDFSWYRILKPNGNAKASSDIL